jgi:hypothetical protein
MKASNCFCGGKAVMHDEGNGYEHSYRLECSDCWFDVDPAENGWTRSGAIKAWNHVVDRIKNARCPVCNKNQFAYYGGIMWCENCEHRASFDEDESWDALIDRFTGEAILAKCRDGFQQCHICLKLSCGDNDNIELQERHKQ